MITLSLENKVDNGDTKVKTAFRGQQNKGKKINKEVLNDSQQFGTDIHTYFLFSAIF